jgi:hypothetical protein
VEQHNPSMSKGITGATSKKREDFECYYRFGAAIQTTSGKVSNKRSSGCSSIRKAMNNITVDCKTTFHDHGRTCSKLYFEHVNAHMYSSSGGGPKQSAKRQRKVNNRVVLYSGDGGRRSES